MKYCKSKDSRMGIYIIQALLISMGLCIIVVQLMGELGAATWKDLIGVLVFIGCLCIANGLVVIWMNRKYRLTPQGIETAYFPVHKKMIPWDQITEVAVCRVHYNTKLGWETVIRVVAGNEPYGPKRGDGLWSGIEYSIKNRSWIIIIDYTEAAKEEFQSVCTLPIVDYR